MGRRGPQATPLAILKARGSWLAKKRVTEGEPIPEPGAYRPPMWLSHEAKRFWKETMEHLEAVGVASRMDAAAFIRYCAYQAQWAELLKRIEADGIIKNIDGEESASPRVETMFKLSDRLLKLEQEFGLTPAARSRVKVNPKSGKQKENKSRFFGAG